MKKKGFTMVELLAVIAILAIIMLIAVPIFGGIANQTNQSVYESKIANVKAAAEAYAEESGRIVFDIRTLIEAGKIEADNESGEYRNPVTKKDMKCYVINVRYENLHYYANVHETSECYSNDKLEEMYGAFKIIAYTDNEKSDTLVPVSDIWYNTPVYIGYGLTNSEYYKNLTISKVVWQGDRIFSCSKDAGNLNDCDFYGGAAFGTSGGISNMKVGLEVTFRNEAGAEFISKTSKVIAVDMEGPRVVSVVAGLGNTNQSGKRVDIEMTDGNGSGLLEYKMVKVASVSSPLPIICANESGYKPVTQSKMVEYQDNGIYYTCVRDKVGNDNQSTLESSKIEVTGVDYSHVNGKSFKIKTSGESTPLTTKATIALDSVEDTSKLKMCVSNTGFLTGCSFEDYKSNFDWDIVGKADCKNRTVYLSISDAAGNVTNIVSNPYSPVDTVKYDANGGSLVTASDSKKTACYDGKYALPSAKKTGYTLDGWYTEKNGGTKITSTSKVDFNGLRTLYAHWIINSYKVTWDGNGATSFTNGATSVKYNHTVGTLGTAERTGYTFNGWYTKSSGGDIVTKDTKVTSDVTYYAHWIKNYYLDLNGLLDGNMSGNISGYGTADVYINGSRVKTGTDDYYAQHPVGTKYEIKNINATAHHSYKGKTSISGTIGTKNEDIRLEFVTNSHTVKWDGNGATSVTNGATSVKYNHTVGKLGTAKKTGYTFKGWYTKSSGGDQVTKDTKVISDVTYYAHWKINGTAITSDNIKNYQGKYVSYSKCGRSFQIFYYDDNGKYGTSKAVYLIADYDDYETYVFDLPFVGYDAFGSTKVKQLNPSMGAIYQGSYRNDWVYVAGLANPASWEHCLDKTYATYAVGAPSVEMWADARKIMYPNSTFSAWWGDAGYNISTPQIGRQETEPNDIFFKHKKTYWLCSASSLHYIDTEHVNFTFIPYKVQTAKFSGTYYKYVLLGDRESAGVRPLVQLNTNVRINGGNGTKADPYKLIIP